MPRRMSSGIVLKNMLRRSCMGENGSIRELVTCHRNKLSDSHLDAVITVSRQVPEQRDEAQALPSPAQSPHSWRKSKQPVNTLTTRRRLVTWLLTVMSLVAKYVSVHV